jgi:hypothetical protein
VKNDSWPIAKMPYPAEATLYQCNHGIIYNRRKRKKIELEQKIVTQKRQYSKAKYCDCEFKVKIVEPIDKDKHVELHIIIFNGCKNFHCIFLEGGRRKGKRGGGRGRKKNYCL